MLETILTLLNSEPVKAFLLEYAATRAIDKMIVHSRRLFRRMFCKSNDLEWQLITCLKNALVYTCAYFEWSYNPKTIIETFLDNWVNIMAIDSKESLQSVLEGAVGKNDITEEELDYWIYEFYKCASDPSYMRLSRFLLLNRDIDVRKKGLKELYPKFLTNGPADLVPFYKSKQHDLNHVLKQLIEKKQSMLLFGLGGIGKTEFAKDVAKQVANMPSANSGIEYIAWVSYTNNSFKTSLISSLYQTSEMDNLDSAWERTREIIYTLRESLLVVVDNVETDKDDSLAQINDLPCRFVLTSRVEHIASLTPYEIKELSPEQCMELFYDYYSVEQNDEVLREILMLADYHTVTIDLMARIADVEEYLLKDFRNKLVMNGFEFSQEPTASTHPRLAKEQRIIEHLKILFSIMDCSESTKEILVRSSCIPSIEFTYRIAKTYLGINNQAELKNLVKIGWLRCSNIYPREFWMHSVVAASIRAQNADILYDNCRSIMISVGSDLIEKRNETKSETRKLIQLSWAISDVFAANLAKESDFIFLRKSAKLFTIIGNHRKASDFYKRANDVASTTMPESDMDAIDTKAELAKSYKYTGRNAEALFLYMEALNSLAGDNETTQRYRSVLLNNIGALYHAMGMVEEGKQNHEEALTNWQSGLDIYQGSIDIKKKLGKQERISLSNDYNSVGVIYKAMGKYDLALSFHHRALSIRKRSRNKLLIATTYNNIGVVFREMKNFRKAMKHYNKALKIRTDVLGPKHLDTVLVQYNQGVILSDNGKYRMAMDIFLVVLAILKETTGDKHYYFRRVMEQFEKTYVLSGGKQFDEWIKVAL